MKIRTTRDESKIKMAVANFFLENKVVYATPGTERYHSNFHGSTWICPFTQAQLAQHIQCYHDNYNHDEHGHQLPIQVAIDEIIGDMQRAKPEEAS